jgi:hypothetical protein
MLRVLHNLTPRRQRNNILYNSKRSPRNPSNHTVSISTKLVTGLNGFDKINYPATTRHNSTSRGSRRKTGLIYGR